MIKRSWGLSVGVETKNIDSKIISFYEWGRTKDPNPITIQMFDKTMIKTMECGQKPGNFKWALSWSHSVMGNIDLEDFQENSV